MVAHPNALLSITDAGLLQRISSRARVIDLPQHRLITESLAIIDAVYFPHSGVISNVVELASGDAIETSMVGHDGVFGAAAALDDKVSISRAIVRISGSFTVVDGALIAALAVENESFRRLLISYEQFNAAQMQQTAACNASHKVEARLCRWLLRMRELAGNDLPVTQEFLAQMIGVRRSSVTEVALDLARTGIMSYSRGHIRVTDVEGLRARCCECHEQVEHTYDRLMGPR